MNIPAVSKMQFLPQVSGLLSVTVLAAVLAAAMAGVTPAQAGEGHDHGEAPTNTGAAALPRFAAASELFELVGVLNGKQLTLYLDHAASNAPVKDGKLELEIGGVKLQPSSHGVGEFELTLDEAPKVGVTTITATVVSADETDLLVGELDIHEDIHADEGHVHSWQERALWGGGGIAALLMFVASGLLARRLLAGLALRRGAAA